MTDAQQSAPTWLLDREGVPNQIADGLGDTLQLCRDVIDFGCVLLDRWIRSVKTAADQVIIGHFFRHTLASLDSVESCLKCGALLGSLVSSRSLLESYIYLAWILRERTEHRARAFYAWNLRGELDSLAKLHPESDERARFERVVTDLPEVRARLDDKKTQALAEERDGLIRKILANERYSKINGEFDRLRGDRLYDVPWHRIDGPNRIADVAQACGLAAEYRVFYSLFSEAAHAADFFGSVELLKEGIAVEPIRGAKGFDTTVRISLTVMFRVLRLLSQRYSADHTATEIDREYAARWRTRFLGIPQIKVVQESIPQDL